MDGGGRPKFVYVDLPQDKLATKQKNQRKMFIVRK